jgi:hypothetical protein
MNKLLLLITICIIVYFFSNTKILYFNKNNKSSIEKYCNNGSTNIEIKIPDSQPGLKILYWTVSNSSSNFNNSGITNIYNGIANINIQCVDNNKYIYFRVINEDEKLSQVYNQKINL